MLKIIKIGKFLPDGGISGWKFSNEPEVPYNNGNYAYELGLDNFYKGSVDINGIEIVEWSKKRVSILQRKNNNIMTILKKIIKIFFNIKVKNE